MLLFGSWNKIWLLNWWMWRIWQVSAPYNNEESIKVLHWFVFSSKLQHVTAFALNTTATGGGGGWWRHCWQQYFHRIGIDQRGVPEALKHMLNLASLHDDYKQSYLWHMTLDWHVLALAYCNLGTMNTPSLSGKSHTSKWKSFSQNVEQNLIFAR